MVQELQTPPQVPGIILFENSFQDPVLQQGPWAKSLAKNTEKCRVALYPRRAPLTKVNHDGGY